MEEDKKSTLSFIERMKQKTLNQKTYGGEYVEVESKMNIRICPNCGAGRAKQEGLTRCSYCNFEFLAGTLSDGITIKKEDNSK